MNDQRIVCLLHRENSNGSLPSLGLSLRLSVNRFCTDLYELI